MDALANPYRPGAGTAPPALIGRDDLITRFGVTVRRALQRRPGKSLMPIGLTVLLNRFAEISEQEGLKVAAIESPENGDFRVLLAVTLRRVLLEFDRMGVVGTAKAAVLKALQVLKTFTLQLPDGATIAIDVDALAGTADSGILSEDVTALLVAVGEAAAARQSGLLLSIDEVQYLAGDELAALITAIHRTTQLNLPVVLVGAGLPQLPGLAGDAKSYAERLFDFPEIGSLWPDDAAAAIAIPAPRTGVSVTSQAPQIIVSEAKGYPYFLQEWGYRVWDPAGRTPITVKEAISVKPDFISQLERNFFLFLFHP